MSNKSAWGPALWKYLHIAASYCEDADAFCGLLRSVAQTMPCPECRAHLAQYLSRLPPESTIRGEHPVDTATVYVFDLHNHVNGLIGKPPLPRSAMRDGEVSVAALSQKASPPVQAAPQPAPLIRRRAATAKMTTAAAVPPPSSRNRSNHHNMVGSITTVAAAGGLPPPSSRQTPTPARGLRYRQ